MAKSLLEYLDWLDGRPDLIWPRPPAPAPLKATPYLKPLAGIRAVTWSVYGTLLTISDGELLHLHPQQLRMQIALQKTIEEFRMWQSMSRKPGAPWEYMLQQYTRIVEDARLAGTRRKGDAPEIDSGRVWHKLLDRLERNGYEYDRGFYGDLDELSVKVAYFFHANLQGMAPSENACDALQSASSAGVRQGLLGDAQPFTLAQVRHALRKERGDPGLGRLFDSEVVVFSCRQGVRTPSRSLYAHAAVRFQQLGIEPAAVLYVSHRLDDDLAVAKLFGFRTALYAADAHSCRSDPALLRDPQTRPDRLLTDLRQIGEILGG